MTSATSAEARRDELVERLFGSALGAMDLLCVYLGDRLGLYRALRAEGPCTPAQLARVASVSERYAREWLEQQAMAGILEVDDPQAADTDRRYALPAGHDEVLLDAGSLNNMAPMAQLLVACTLPIHAVVDAFRTGGGVPYADYGADLHEGQARFTGPLFDGLLVTEWLPAVPRIHDRLRADPPARVADLACGLGRSAIAIARGYPKVVVDGIDLDEASIARASEHLAGSGVEDRVTFACRDGADPALAGRYELVTIFEALHDMSRPVDVLRAARGMLAEGGVVLVGDERTAERFSLDAGDLERLYYGFSVLHCLPVGMVGEDPAGTGTVIREDTVRRYARDAGFGTVEVAPIDNDFWRFYVLTP
ncbi:MAG: class I SAM-dependent methyltransferase [Solirubrobacterales bacterium]|nr:class I SAM-dependent methyltransferase [Solirubrobacterales bacterium]